MKIKIPSLLKSLVLLLALFAFTVHAAEKRVGLALYDIASGENADYLKKVAKESLSASLQARGYTVVDLPYSEDEIKRRGVSTVLKKDRLDALVAGSIVKLGSNAQIFTRIYSPENPSQPVVLTSASANVDALLGTLTNHAQLIATELSKSAPVVAAVPAPAPMPASLKTKPEKASPLVAPTPVPAPSSAVTPAPAPAVEASASPKTKKTKTPEVKSNEPVPGSAEMVRESGTPTMPDYTWISTILPYEGRGMAYGDVNGDGQKEIVIVDLKHVYVYEFIKNQVRLLYDYQGSEDDAFVRVYTKDLNGDGKEEILVSNISRGQGASFALEVADGSFKTFAKKSPWIVKVLNWNGSPLLIGEFFNSKQVDYHDIRQLIVENGKFKDAGKFEVPSEMGIYGLQSFKSQSNSGDQVLYLNSSGYLKIYDIEDKNKFKKRWSSSERYGGTANFLRLEQTDMFNEVVNSFTYFNVEPVTWMASDGYGSLMVPKNDDFLRNMIGTRPVVKNTWFTKLHWQDIGMRETLSTRKIDGYFADNIKVQLPWEKQPKLLALLWVRDKGFMNAMGAFKSVVVIYDL